ncbi:RNA recognition motif domain [Dillenia turbinata]|uniref:RNA recognition motif domain n=1 Tax=Dillenia turbinata TaxID=194707 RepID=A0AAN8WEL2_9MAGN
MSFQKKFKFWCQTEELDCQAILFSGYNVLCDHVSGKSKGYGFVHFKYESAACTALKEMDGQLLDGWNIRVDYANKG